MGIKVIRNHTLENTDLVLQKMFFNLWRCKIFIANNNSGLIVCNTEKYYNPQKMLSRF